MQKVVARQHGRNGTAREAAQETAGALARLGGVMEALAVAAREAAQEIAGALSRLGGVMEALAKEMLALGAVAKELGQAAGMVPRETGQTDGAKDGAREETVEERDIGQTAGQAAKADVAAKTTLQEMPGRAKVGVMEIGEAQAGHGQMEVASAGRVPKEETKIGTTTGRVSLIASDAL